MRRGGGKSGGKLEKKKKKKKTVQVPPPPHYKAVDVLDFRRVMHDFSRLFCQPSLDLVHFALQWRDDSFDYLNSKYAFFYIKPANVKTKTRGDDSFDDMKCEKNGKCKKNKEKKVSKI
mgnify:CR=1 FL=1